MPDLTHFDKKGRVQMVDVSAKADSNRQARAQGCVRMGAKALASVMAGDARKGDVMTVAELAAIMGAKQTSALIPLCHPLPLSALRATITIDETLPGLRVVVEATTTGKTGVEMEALTGVSIACLTIYDMVKAIDKAMVIDGICLLEKSGGQSGHYVKDRPGSRDDGSPEAQAGALPGMAREAGGAV